MSNDQTIERRISMNQFSIDVSAAVQESNAPISVSDLNVLARQLIEQNIPLLWVAGEISNLTRAASGHLYFSLKDARAQARCVMFRHRMRYLDWSPTNGMQVEVRARPTLYEARGEFQLTVEFMRRAGLGALYEAFARLKAKLEAEGLFAAERKAPLPSFARRIGVVTSPAAAALHDVLTTLRRRMPAVPIVVYPAPVQGEGAAEKLAAAIEVASARRECDVLILCRGGGSIEDLWAFNEERVARAISACSVPLVCGVGHETDITIADFVADARAPTPTAAAEMVSPNRADLAARVDAWRARLSRALVRRLERRMQQVDYLARRLTHPGERIRSQHQHLTHLHARLGRSGFHALRQAELHLSAAWHRLGAVAPDVAGLQARCAHHSWQLLGAMQQAQERRGQLLARLAAHLSALSPQRVLERGYAIVAHSDGAIVRAGADLTLSEEVSLTFARGAAQARITGTRSS
ncbi:MAG TPA: exodeoxyribonuclease VII large subunit [Burkholderiales bacterium]|nr:exodeoxyribonuclease VII large subunit [Burkholderiales bacterium]